MVTFLSSKTELKCNHMYPYDAKHIWNWKQKQVFPYNGSVKMYEVITSLTLFVFCLKCYSSRIRDKQPIAFSAFTESFSIYFLYLPKEISCVNFAGDLLHIFFELVKDWNSGVLLSVWYAKNAKCNTKSTQQKISNLNFYTIELYRRYRYRFL